MDTSDTAVGGVDMCIIAQFEVQKIGLKLNLRRNLADGYWGTIFRQTPFYMSTWSPRPTADIILSLLFDCEAPYNESQFNSARVDQLLVDGRAQTDLALRSEIYCEIQTIIHNEAGNIIPWHQSIVDGAPSKVRAYRWFQSTVSVAANGRSTSAWIAKLLGLRICYERCGPERVGPHRASRSLRETSGYVVS